MAKVNLDGNEFSSEELSVKAKIALTSLQILDARIEQILAQSQVVETAHDFSVDEVRRILRL